MVVASMSFSELPVALLSRRDLFVVNVSLGRLGLQDGVQPGYPGDAACWKRFKILTRPDHGFADGEARKAVQPVFSRQAGLSQVACCSAGRRSACWDVDHHFERCCMSPRPRQPHGACWPTPLVKAICCEVRSFPMCGLYDSTEGSVFAACCGQEQRISAPDSRRMAHELAHQLAPFRSYSYPAGCATRLLKEELAFMGDRNMTDVPAMVVGDLGTLAAYFYDTGDQLLQMQVMFRGLIWRGGDAFEMCPSAAVLAHLLEVERSLHSRPIQQLRESLDNVKLVWQRLEPRLAAAEEVLTKAHAPPEQQPQPPYGNTQDMTAASRHLRKHLDELAREVVLARTVTRAIVRTEKQVARMDALIKQRAESSFTAHIVMPMCWPRDGKDVQRLNTFFSSLDVSTIEFYLYDVCFTLFPPGSTAYQLDNKVQVESPGSRMWSPKQAQEHRLIEPFPDALFQLSQHFKRTVIVPLFVEIPIGEIGAYTRHIDLFYDDRLADVTLFVHPDMEEHMPIDAQNVIVRAMALGQWPALVSFVHVGHRHSIPVDSSGRVASELGGYCTMREENRSGSVFAGGLWFDRVDSRDPTGWYCDWVQMSWELLFNEKMQLPRDDYGAYDFASFAATREAIMRRPRAFWANAWKSMSRKANYQRLPGLSHVSPLEFSMSGGKDRRNFGYHYGMTMAWEHLYHVMMFPRDGMYSKEESIKARSWLWPTRHRDPSLPLGFKFDESTRNPRLHRYYRFEPHDPL